MEVAHHLSRLEDEYHDPMKFRYNLNAILGAMKSVPELLQKEIEANGDIQAWNVAREPFRDDPWLAGIARARNVTFHQKAIFDGSRVHIGLYRGRRHKLSLGVDVARDISSDELLRRWASSEAGNLFLDPEHSAVGEQYGVWRRYYVEEINKNEDVLTHLRRGLIRNHDLLNAAHALYSIDIGYLPDDPILSADSIAKVTVLLESDVDPTLPSTWGWE